ncbi:MAG: excinuclease ABC subunit UvrC [Bacteriovoracaceae bacterium]|nr:excinuclease ABC subunit UvrC [Bacteriovoracaceae bacterium]
MPSNKENLFLKAKNLPVVTGCYLMRGEQAEILYIGKAKNLKERVLSYFQDSNHTIATKTYFLVKKIRDFDFIITASEAEALVLENNLIKKYSPRYNIQLKDDKTYPYVLIDQNEVFPRLEYVRKPKRGKGRIIIGPFIAGGELKDVLRILTKCFKLRDCSMKEFLSRKEPCLLYQMHQCSAPCVDKIDVAEYNKNLDYAKNFLIGKSSQTINFLKKKMQEYAETEAFEQALMIRDCLERLELFLKHDVQKNAELKSSEDIDVVGYYEGEIEVDLSIYLFRRGILIGNKSFHFLKKDFMQDILLEIELILMQYYNTSYEIPEKIIVPWEKIENFQVALEKMLSKKIEVTLPKIKYKNISNLVQSNAQETQVFRIKEEINLFEGLELLQKLLHLSERPKVLECFDVAIWQGKSPTASQIVFYEGRPDRKNYRYYHLQERLEGNNDFAMLAELLRRRLKKGDFPDVFIVDGGQQQVNTLAQVLKEQKIEIPIIGIAKARTKGSIKTTERLYFTHRKNPYELLRSRSLMKIITSMRDEAHRFSRKLHHHAEKKRVLPNMKQ